MNNFEDLLTAIVQDDPNTNFAIKLANAGIDLNQQHEQGGTPLMIAAALARTAMAKVLLQLGAECSITHEDTNLTALHYACGSGAAEIVQMLIDQSAPIEARDRQGWTPLMFAVQEGHLDCVDCMLKAGAAVDATDSMQRTALMQAARCGHLQIAELLIAAGANVHAVCGWATALIMAATAGNTAIAEILIEHGADIDELDEKEGYSALMMAALGGHVECVELLMANGADVNLSTEFNVTAVTMARRGEHFEIEALLMDSGATEPEPVPLPVLFPFGYVGDPILCQQMPKLS